MQIEAGLLGNALDWAMRGGNAGLLAIAAYVLVKVNSKLKRDEDVKSDYPPHRHINGNILYPHEYEPSAIDQLK